MAAGVPQPETPMNRQQVADVVKANLSELQAKKFNSWYVKTVL